MKLAPPARVLERDLPVGPPLGLPDGRVRFMSFDMSVVNVSDLRI
jgi:hypothetical protein